MKKNYAKITFINCEIHYSECICEWHDVSFQIQAAESDWVHRDKFFIEQFGKPRISITMVRMTEKTFLKIQHQQDLNN